jgi:hypothetical protein
MSQIHTALIAAMDEIARRGIAKLSRADLGGAKVNYRGIEAAMNEMCVVLIHHKISVTPSYSELQIGERAKGDPKDAKATRFATLKGSFKFEAEDGSAVVCECYGEAMDSGDKAVTKAQSVAFRTALFQQFVVPTMAMDPEADAPDDSSLPDLALAAAEQGLMAYQAYWAKLSAEDKRALEPHHAELKRIAQDADRSGK